MHNKERFCYLFVGFLGGIAWGFFIWHVLWQLGLIYPMYWWANSPTPVAC